MAGTVDREGEFVGRSGFPVPVAIEARRPNSAGTESETNFDSALWLRNMSTSQRRPTPLADLSDLDPVVLGAFAQLPRAMHSDLTIPTSWLDTEAMGRFLIIGENLGMRDRFGVIQRGEPKGDLMILSIATPLYKQSPRAGRTVLMGYVDETEDNQQGFAGGHPGVQTFRGTKTNYLEGVIRESLGLTPLNQTVTPRNRHRI